MGQRLGAGKVRHLQTQYLWVQDVFHTRRATLRKIPGPLNPADLMTKHVGAEDINRLFPLLSFYFTDGRSDLSLRASV